MEITYENCESLSIPNKIEEHFINLLKLEGISKDYIYGSGKGTYYNTVDNALIIIKDVHKLAKFLANNKKEPPFIFLSDTESKEDYIVNLLINRQDITQLTVNGQDYYVPYDDHSTSAEFNYNPINYCQINEYRNPVEDWVTIKFKQKK